MIHPVRDQQAGAVQLLLAAVSCRSSCSTLGRLSYVNHQVPVADANRDSVAGSMVPYRLGAKFRLLLIVAIAVTCSLLPRPAGLVAASRTAKAKVRLQLRVRAEVLPVPAL